MDYPPEIVEVALANVDRERKRLREEFERAMRKLDNDERDLLGLKPLDDE